MKINNLTNLPVEAGGHLYLHNIEIRVPYSSNQGEYWSFILYTNNETAFTQSTLITFLKTLENNTYIPATFRINTGSIDNKIYLNCYIKTYSSAETPYLGKILTCSKVCIDLTDNTLTSTSTNPHSTDSSVVFNSDKVTQIF